jgi:uncharacterized protein (TIGR00369 family)
VDFAAAAARFATTPVHRLLGLRLVARDATQAIVALPMRPELLQEAGLVQGGLMASLADAAAVWLLWPTLPEDRTMTGIDCSLQFLQAARPEHGELLATAVLLRSGRTIAVVDSVVSQAGRTVARGTFTFLQQPRRIADEPPTGS